MRTKWVAPKQMDNAQVREIQKRFAGMFWKSFATGSFRGGRDELSGSSVGWHITLSLKPRRFIVLQLSEDSSCWIVKEQRGDVSEVAKALREEGFTLGC